MRAPNRVKKPTRPNLNLQSSSEDEISSNYSSDLSMEDLRDLIQLSQNSTNKKLDSPVPPTVDQPRVSSQGLIRDPSSLAVGASCDKKKECRL